MFWYMNKVKLPSIWPAVCDVWLCGGAIELVIEVMRDNESWWAAAAAAKAEDIMPSTMLAWWPKEAEMGVVALVSLKPSSLSWPWWWPTIAGLKSGWTLKTTKIQLFYLLFKRIISYFSTPILLWVVWYRFILCHYYSHLRSKILYWDSTAVFCGVLGALASSTSLPPKSQ